MPAESAGRVERGHHQRGVGDRAGHRPAGVELAGERIDTLLADAQMGRLQAHDAAQRRRDAHGTAGVRTHGAGNEAGRHGAARTAARSAAHLAAVPRVLRRAEIRVDPGRAEGEFVQVGEADDDAARRAQGGDGFGVRFARTFGNQARAAGPHHAPNGEQVLDRQRHAVQRAEIVARHDRRLGGAGVGQRQVRIDRDEGAQPAVQPLDPVEAGLHGLDRRNPLLPDILRQVGDRHPGQFVHCMPILPPPGPPRSARCRQGRHRGRP